MIREKCIAVVLYAIVMSGVSGVKNLMGEPDYRQVRLYWETDIKSAPKNGYNIRYCELQTWGAQRCRLQSVNMLDNSIKDKNKPSKNQNLSNQTEIVRTEKLRNESNSHVKSNSKAVDDNLVPFSTDIKGLRMATTYSFEIKALKDDKEREERSEGDDRNENMIVIPTKGFSAKATQCLPQASEIEVSTGPYFGGRIAVEAADGERCAIDGDPKSSRDTYTLRINHDECGSQVNDTTVATFVLVQENLPILTHSTRRFLVLCSYQPDTLTVRAGISLPTGLQHKGQVYIQPAAVPTDEDEEYEQNALGRRSRNLRTGRLMQKPEALVKGEEDPAGTSETATSEAAYSRSNAVPIFVITMLAIAGVIGLVAIALKISGRKILLDDLDNVSIASELSVSSCGSVCEDAKKENNVNSGKMTVVSVID